MNRMTLGVCALGLAFAACAGPDKKAQEQHPWYDPGGFKLDPSEEPPSEVEPEPPAPWTKAFMQSAALLADEVIIEGPVGILDHTASVRHTLHERVAKPVPAGFLQDVRVKTANAPPIGAQLDALQIKALRRLVILEKVGDVDVVVRARGGAFWSDGLGNEQRGDTLEFVGKVER